MRIARVFPTKTNMCPDDKDAYFGLPPLGTPKYDEVHISTTFTWDLPKVERLMSNWSKCGEVKLGGPAYGDPGGDFVQGMYLKKGITITSRGCPNHCSFCLVPHREGSLRELSIVEGQIIQDNNLLACSQNHLDSVFTMLGAQRNVNFKGGLEAKRVTPQIVEKLRQLHIHEVWLSYDQDTVNCYNELVNAVEHLKPYFKQNQIRCYVLIGYEGDTLEAAESRLRQAYKIGTLPFAMRFRTPELQWERTFIHPEREWNLLTRQWIRPAIIKSRMKNI